MGTGPWLAPQSVCLLRSVHAAPSATVTASMRLAARVVQADKRHLPVCCGRQASPCVNAERAAEIDAGEPACELGRISSPGFTR